MSNTYLPIEERQAIKTDILEGLYKKQFRYWNDQLTALSHENTESWGRTKDKIFYAIFWERRAYYPHSWEESTSRSTPFCLPLNLRIKDFVPRMEKIAHELDTINDEKYEVERFLSNLVLFDASSDRFRDILGQTVHRFAAAAFERYCANNADRDWKLNNEFSLKTFVDANKHIIIKMSERVMLNLVTL